MKMVKALVVSAGLVLSAGSALAAQVDADELHGTWNATIEGPEGEGTVRVVFLENGSYLAIAMLGDSENPVPFWEIGEWELDDDTLSMEATSSSEPMDEADTMTELTIEDLDDGVLSLSNEDDPMWSQLEFIHADTQIVGVWQGETEGGDTTFAFAQGGGFVAAMDDEVMWGTWTQDDDELAFEITDDAWAADFDGNMEEHSGTIESLEGDSLITTIEGLGDDIEWERTSIDPLVGEWQGNADGADITFIINDDSTFEITMDAEGEEMTIEGIWTVVGPGQMFLAVTGDGPEPTTMHFIFTSPDDAMFGENMDDLEDFERQ